MEKHTSFPVKKLIAATCAIAVSLVGIVMHVPWLTVAALVVWFVAMLVLGPGRRNSGSPHSLMTGTENHQE